MASSTVGKADSVPVEHPTSVHRGRAASLSRNICHNVRLIMVNNMATNEIIPSDNTLRGPQRVCYSSSSATSFRHSTLARMERAISSLQNHASIRFD